MPSRRHPGRFLPGIDQLLIIFFVVTLALGTLGWILSPKPAPPMAGHGGITAEQDVNAFYRSLQMFTLNYDHPIPDDGWHPSIVLNVARFMAALFFVTALVVKFSRTVRNAMIRRFYAHFFRGRQYLVVGYGRVGQGLARMLKEKHPNSRVVAIDRQVKKLDREAADFAAIELYEADAHEIESFGAVPISIAKMEKILVSIGNDQRTIATAARLYERHGDQINTIWMQLNDWMLLDRLRNSSSLSEPADGDRKIRSFSMAEALGTQLVTKYQPALMAQRFGQNRLHAILVRFDDFVWALAEALVLNGMSPPPRLARPRLTIIDAKADAQKQLWQARHPYLHEWADITFLQADPASVAWSAEGQLLDDVETLDPPTLYIFGRSGDGDALTDGLSLRHGMKKGLRQPAPVFLTSEVEGIDRLGLRTIAANLQDRLEIIGADAEMAGYSHVIDPWFEELSQHFFFAYELAGTGRSVADVSEKEFANLTRKYLAQEETLQVSNRRAAIHATQILVWLGFEQCDATEPFLALPASSGAALKALFVQKPANPSPGCVNWRDMWALYEHMRWCADRAVDGWRHGLRDDEARLRDQMNRGRYDYWALEKHDVKKDTAQADAAADLLSKARPDEDPFRLARIETLDMPWRLAWQYEAGVLGLRMPEDFLWPPLAPDGAIQRLVLVVPPEAALAARDPAFAKLPPKARKDLRLAAYRNFVASLQHERSQRPWLRFRLMRCQAEGWEWLGKEISTEVVEGCTLPPLTVGFVGVSALVSAENVELIGTELLALLGRLAGLGRKMRLIICAGDGVQRMMIELWRGHEMTSGFPVVVLDAAGKRGPACGKPEERILRSDDALFDMGGQAQNPELLAETGERILNVCDQLIALYDDRPGALSHAAGKTVEHAMFLGIKIHRIPCSSA